MTGPKPDCPLCQGAGAYYGTQPVCCMRPERDGSCCGSPEQEVVQCQCAAMAASNWKPVPDGFVLVQVKPTTAMIEAASKCDGCWGYHESSLQQRRPDVEDVHDVWAAMLAASQGKGS